MSSCLVPNREVNSTPALSLSIKITREPSITHAETINKAVAVSNEMLSKRKLILPVSRMQKALMTKPSAAA